MRSCMTPDSRNALLMPLSAEEKLLRELGEAMAATEWLLMWLPDGTLAPSIEAALVTQLAAIRAEADAISAALIGAPAATHPAAPETGWIRTKHRPPANDL